ncbi:TonB-dependent receptor plug domain-containing protein [Candidatus Phycosocius spiralis]|uniref:Ligand-gated channel n=1 Tax=Candidatus Phycosocius spiralis TaxID=2815099 RepID=A0ABQ4PYY2_9PROT|nr:TonB-dependent receptor [Candidatus Phycosocius spiralis]GIU68136.1 ligand-gated channel [Candidatus Phycosocius spiralis]
MTSVIYSSTALVMSLSFLIPALANAQTSPSAPIGKEVETVTVIGSRGKPRTDVERPVPVDVLSGADLKMTGQTDLAQQVQFTSPSFNSTKFGINGATNFADPASLRGLAPDQVLLLINGKRRHQFSALNLNVSPGLGTVVSDMNSVPTAAIARIEVLRDGAAAQYGSDAIAGIINLTLNRASSGTHVVATTGVHHEGDGITYKTSLNQGLELGDGGFFNYTLEYFKAEGTNRSDPFTGTIYPTAPAGYVPGQPIPTFPYLSANPRQDRGVYPTVPFRVGQYGSNENETSQAFVNAELPLNDAILLYGFAGYSKKTITAFGFFRAPVTTANAVLSIFPDGYVPILPGESIDSSATFGLRGDYAGWGIDVSYGYGQNTLDQWARNTVNASLGTSSPTSFYVGQTKFGQHVVDIGASRAFGQIGVFQALNLALGAQYREDNFKVKRGDPASYAIGPLAISGRAAGSNGRPGYAPADENDLTRSNVGAYVDVEADVSEALLVTTALRYEDYSDFGGNLSGKLAGRYKITEDIGLRASYNLGFRAPSLAQIGNRVNTSTVQNNQILQTQQISSDDSRLASLGIAQPEAEISNNYGLGLTGRFSHILGGDVSATLDLFQIDIQDRIVITEGVLTANFPAVAALFPGVREIRFFTNHIDTKTQGVDLVVSYKNEVFDGDLTLTLAATNSETTVEKQRDTPAQLLAGASAANQGFKLLGPTSIELIEVAIPRNKVLVSSSYSKGKFTYGARASYFGPVTAFSTGLSAKDPNVNCNTANRCAQDFGGKTLVDLTLSFQAHEKVTITGGINNVFDIYPDKWNNLADGYVGEAASYSNGQTPFTRNAGQFGFNGAYYFVTATFSY